MATNFLPGLNSTSLPAADSGVLASLGSARPFSAGAATSILSHPQNIPLRLPVALSQPPTAPGRYLSDALKSRWQAYRKQLRHCRAQFSEEAIHELRVATRRLLAQFVLLGDVAPSISLEKARRSLKRRLADLGDLRDTQVQRLFVEQHANRYPETESLRRWLKRRERSLIKSALGKVKGTRTKKLERRIAALVEDLANGHGKSGTKNRLAAAVLRAASKAFAEAVKRRQAISLTDLGTVHQTRIAFKRFRYMAESLSPGLTGLSKRQLRALAYFQRRMGIIQDLEVIQRGVRGFLQEHKGSQDSLRPFSLYLRQRRARALRAFVKNADGIFTFWPPVKFSGTHSAHEHKHRTAPDAQPIQNTA